MQLGRVFISSAFRDMMPLRDAAAEAVKLAGMEPVPAEDHVAQTGPVRDALAREIQHCDTYVGIFDKNRGTGAAGKRPGHHGGGVSRRPRARPPVSGIPLQAGSVRARSRSRRVPRHRGD